MSAAIDRALEQASSQSLFDRNRPPDSQPCMSCGTPIEPVWWSKPPRYRHLPVRSRWLAGCNPCERCEGRAEDRQAQAEIDVRQRRAEIPRPYRHHRWSGALLQRDGEPFEDFVHRIRGAKLDRGEHGTGVALGVSLANAKACRAVQSWRPEKGWLYMQGPVGTGKSLLLAVVGNALLQSGGLVWAEWTDDELRRRGVRRDRYDAYRAAYGAGRFHSTKRYEALYVSEHEVMRRVELAWKKDPAPLSRISSTPVLLYDDLGSSEWTMSGKNRAAEEVEKLICARYAAGLPMAITSNHTLDELAHPNRLGLRTVSRLREMCRTCVVLGGPDWREVS